MSAPSQNSAIAPPAPSMVPESARERGLTPLERLTRAMGSEAHLLDSLHAHEAEILPLDRNHYLDPNASSRNETERALLPFKINIGQCKSKNKYGRTVTIWGYLVQHKHKGEKGVPSVRYFKGPEIYRSVEHVFGKDVLQEVALRKEFPKTNEQGILAATVNYYFFKAKIAFPFPITITESFRRSIKVAANKLNKSRTPMDKASDALPLAASAPPPAASAPPPAASAHRHPNRMVKTESRGVRGQKFGPLRTGPVSASTKAAFEANTPSGASQPRIQDDELRSLFHDSDDTSERESIRVAHRQDLPRGPHRFPSTPEMHAVVHPSPNTAPATFLTSFQKCDLNSEMQKQLLSPLDEAATKKAFHKKERLEIQKKRIEGMQRYQDEKTNIAKIKKELQTREQALERMKKNVRQWAEQEGQHQHEIDRVNEEERALLESLDISKMEAIVARAKQTQRESQVGANKRRKIDGDSS